MNENITQLKNYLWLKGKAKGFRNCYFDKENTLDKCIPTFKTKGLQKKPDTLYDFNFAQGYGNEYIAVEQKVAARSRNVLDAGKVLDYYEDYITGKIKYEIDGNSKIIRHFAIMTDTSEEGYLFNSEKVIKNNYLDENKLRVLERFGEKIFPGYEYEKTAQFLRSLWENFARFRKKLELKGGGPSLGIITGYIGTEKEKTLPHLFTVIYDVEKKRWGTRYFAI